MRRAGWSRTGTVRALAVLALGVAAVALPLPAGAGPALDPATGRGSDGSVFPPVVHRHPHGAGSQVHDLTHSIAPQPGSGRPADGVRWTLRASAVSHTLTTAAGIIGPDERAQVGDAAAVPYRAVVSLVYRGERQCTGWMIGPDTAVTAGHCVHGGGSDGQFLEAAEFAVVPGDNGTGRQPYGSCRARRLYTTEGWITRRSEEHDYGALKLDCRIGETVGWFGTLVSDVDPNGWPTTVSGYPVDKPAGTMWRSADQVRGSEPRLLYYANDTKSGHSGSPVWQQRPEGSASCVGNCVLAVHTQAFHSRKGLHRRYNHGVRLTGEVVDNLVAWRNNR